MISHLADRRMGVGLIVRHAGIVILGLGGVYDDIDTTFCKLVIRISLVAEINDRLYYIAKFY